jgi:hypothetical protein
MATTSFPGAAMAGPPNMGAARNVALRDLSSSVTDFVVSGCTVEQSTKIFPERSFVS